MKISVIIPNYNYSDFVSQAIRSVYAQTYSNLECIIVDDGSTDNSLCIINNLKKVEFPQLLVVSKQNGGISSARNAGLEKVSGQLIAFLDADDFWLPTKLENQFNHFCMSKVDAVFSNYIYYEDNIYFDHDDTIILRPNIYNFIEKNPVIGSASSLLMKKEVFDRVGYFDTNMKCLEDHNYWFRAILEGFIFEFCPYTDVICRVHLSSRLSDDSIGMFHYHISFLNTQMNVLKSKNLLKLNLPNTLENSLKQRLGRIRWYASRAQSDKHIVWAIIIGIKYLGLKFLFSRLILRQLLASVYNLLVVTKKNKC